MAKNDRNNQKGMLGELAVARSFIEHGCAVNFLTFMDVGMDLHVHMPADLKVPESEDTSWFMSGRTAHVQVKSTTSKRLPAINIKTAQAWNLGASTGTPTLLVAVVVNKEGTESELRFFDPLMVDSLAEMAATRDQTEFTIAVEVGDLVTPDELFERVAYWITNGSYMLSHVIPRPWHTQSEEIWDAAVEMVATLTLMFERRFREPGFVIGQMTYATTAILLAQSFLEGAGIDSSVLDDIPPGENNTRAETMNFQVHDRVNNGGSHKHGWSDWVEQLALVTSSKDEPGALASLGDICTAYGRTVRGKLTMSTP